MSHRFTGTPSRSIVQRTATLATCLIVSTGTAAAGSLPPDDRTITVDFSATVTYVHPLLPGLEGLTGEHGTGRIQYLLAPTAMQAFPACTVHYFDSPARIFSFQLPNAGLSFLAGPASSQFNVEVCDGFRDSVGEGTALVDRIGFFGFGTFPDLAGYEVSNLVIGFADTTATAVSGTAATNILDPERYDVRNFWIMIRLDPRRTTAGLTLSIDSVTVRDERVCHGDCDDNGRITIGELVTGVAIALGGAEISGCAALDVNGDGAVTVDELTRAVVNALGPCGAAAPGAIGPSGRWGG